MLMGFPVSILHGNESGELPTGIEEKCKLKMEIQTIGKAVLGVTNTGNRAVMK